jgi:hypothetical protein
VTLLCSNDSIRSSCRLSFSRPLHQEMGLSSSKYATNDYELVIKLSKELEGFLVDHFDASGQGLHEKITSAHSLPLPLQKQMRYLATVRNELVHEAGCDSIDRRSFIEAFERAHGELTSLLEARRRGYRAQTNTCAVM